MKLEYKNTTPIINWFSNNIKLIKKNPKDFSLRINPTHKGFVMGINNIQKKETQKNLLDKKFPLDSFLNIVSTIKKHYNLPNNLLPFRQEGWMIIYAEEGYICRMHKDESPKGEKHHVKFNIMINKPIKGGQPILFKKELSSSTGISDAFGPLKMDVMYPYIIDVEENEPWICLSDKYVHSTVEVKGDKPRIVISLGFEVDKNQIINNPLIPKTYK